MDCTLEIRNACKHFTTPECGVIKALDDVSIEVDRNEFVTLLGPSGCGKTTLLRAISGFEDLDSGDIRIDGASVAHAPPHRRPVNTVFQRYALFPHLNVARNVAYSLEITGVGKSEIHTKVGEMLEMVGLGNLGERKISQLSGGQQQRVALARSLVAQPKILLLDEPLSALDKNLRQKMQRELKSIQHEVGIAFIFVTHDQEEALTMSDRIAVLGHGLIQQIGTPEALYKHPTSEFVAEFLGEGNLIAGTSDAVDGAAQRVLMGDNQTVSISQTPLAKGAPLKVLVRPEDLYLGPGQDSRDLTYRGKVTEVIYVGTEYRLQIDVGLPTPLIAKFRDANVGHPVIGSDIVVHAPNHALHCVPDGVPA